MGCHIRLPDRQRLCVDLLHEHGAFQRGVIAADHRKGVQRQDIAPFQNPSRNRVMRPVRVQPRLEPNPGVTVFRIREGAGNFRLHRVAACHCHVDFARAQLYRVTDRIASHISHPRTFADQRDFRRGFVHTLAHGRVKHIHHTGRRQKAFQLFLLHQGQVVAFVADHPAFAGNGPNRPPEIIPLPVGIGDIVPMTAPPRLPRVNPGADGDIGTGRHHQPIGAPERAI